MEWLNKYTPGFMCAGRKTHPFGNKTHTFCCGLTSILCITQTAEEKYLPRQLGQK